MNLKAKLKWGVLVYILLWLLTATWGLKDIDKAFDREFAWGDSMGVSGIEIGSGISRSAKQIKVIRLEDVDLRDPYGDTHPANAKNAPKLLWRCRTVGFPVAPFFILDEAGAQWGGLAGIGGRRLAIWFFGWSHYWWIKTYWLL
jgi:hypothetical protein